MSKTKLRQAKFSINELVKKSNRHSYASQADLRIMLFRCIKDLHQLGFKLSHIKGLQAKHIYALVVHWQSQAKSPATIKNYLAKLRHCAVLLNKPKLVKADNAAYQVGKRSYIPQVNKAITQLDLSKCTDAHIRLSLEGQRLFGLRREESLKFIVSQAYQGNMLNIRPSWTKGGVGRTLQIRTDAQRQWLQHVMQLVKPQESLIPKHRTYKQHLSHYQTQLKLIGLHNAHGLRHAYAQTRYQELTTRCDPSKQGLTCPLAGGKKTALLSQEEKKWDSYARQIISWELGHSRTSITRVYLG